MRFMCALNGCECRCVSRERNASKLGAATIIEGSWFQAIIVHGKKENL